MSMPLSRAWRPLALEMMSGRLPWAGAARVARASSVFPFDGLRPKSLFEPARALPASEVRKNLRRDHNSIFKASWKSAGQYNTRGQKLDVARKTARNESVGHSGILF